MKNNTSNTDNTKDPVAILNALKAGNQRFLQRLKNQPTPDLTYQLVQKQTPSAIVLGCADSRVPIELVFDQAIGDLFIIRVAGNIVTPTQVGSIEFGVTEFNIPLIIVLGHTDCGAIKGTMKQQANPQPLSPNLAPIIDAIAPLVKTKQTIQQLTEDNVHHSIAKLKKSEVLKLLLDSKKIMMVGAVYSIETGEVHFLKSGN